LSKKIDRENEPGGLGSRIHARFAASGEVDFPISEDLFEDSAALIIGRVVLAFSRFELNLAFLLEGLASAGNEPQIDRLFKQGLGARIDGVQNLLSACDGLDPSCLAAFQDWKRGMDKVRLLRNRFIHGRWGILAHARQVVNVNSYRANAPGDGEVRYSLPELEAELKMIEKVFAGFMAWRRRWPI
jgi:hypothetical protein